MAFVSGHYAATWNSVDFGTTKDGFRMTMVNHVEMITVDDYGDAPVDAVQRGAEYRLTFDYAEYDLIKPVVAGQTPFGEAKTNVGKLASGLAKSLVMTAQAGTPAAGAGLIATLTATRAVVISDVEILLAAKHRQGPCTFHLFPDPGVSNKPFVVT